MIDELDRVLRRNRDRPALVGLTPSGRVTVRLTTGAIVDQADSYALALHRRGLQAGDTVGFAARPGATAVAVMLAARRLGLCLALLDPTAGPDVLVSRLALARPKLVLADAAVQAIAGWARPLARRIRLELPDLATLAPVATLGRRLPGCAPPLAPARNGPSTGGGQLPDCRDDRRDAAIIFTSGTTSQPRAVVHTWASLSASLHALASLVQPRPGRPVLAAEPFVHIPALTNGATIAMPARSPHALARQLIGLRPQETYLIPPQLRALLAHGARFTGRVWTGSAPVSADLLTRVIRAGATQAWGVYALTELLPVAVVEARTKAAYAGAGDLVGALMPGVEATVDDAGQLMVRGEAACQRYLAGPQLTWIGTGDVGRLDHIHGTTHVVLAGRTKDMVLRRAENIYPGLYEPTLHVSGVGLAVLVGVPAGDGDERLVAVIEPVPGADLRRVRSTLSEPLRRMGAAAPDAVLFARIPLSGRSHKPDRAATARLAAQQLQAEG